MSHSRRSRSYSPNPHSQRSYSRSKSRSKSRSRSPQEKRAIQQYVRLSVILLLFQVEGNQGCAIPGHTLYDCTTIHVCVVGTLYTSIHENLSSGVMDIFARMYVHVCDDCPNGEVRGGRGRGNSQLHVDMYIHV